MASNLLRQIEDWRKRGVIDAQTATRLFDDIDALGSHASKKRTSFSLFTVIAVFAALSLAASILLFVASNWDAIPRLVKVLGIITLVFIGLIGGAIVGRRANTYAAALEEGFYILAGAAYIGGIALVGQMYHLPGSLDEAMFGFAIGLGIAAMAVRSRVLSLAMLFCAAWWYANTRDAQSLLTFNFLWLAVFIGLGLLVARLRADRLVTKASIFALFVALVPFLWQVLEYVGDVYESIPHTMRVALWLVIFFALSLVLMAERFGAQRLRTMPFMAKPRVIQLYALSLVALLALHLELNADLGLLLAVILGLIFAIATLIAHGATRLGLRYGSYLLFILEFFVLFGDRVFSLLGSSGVFFFVSLALAALAFVIYRLERRFKIINGSSQEAPHV